MPASSTRRSPASSQAPTWAAQDGREVVVRHRHDAGPRPTRGRSRRRRPSASRASCWCPSRCRSPPCSPRRCQWSSSPTSGPEREHRPDRNDGQLSRPAGSGKKEGQAPRPSSSALQHLRHPVAQVRHHERLRDHRHAGIQKTVSDRGVLRESRDEQHPSGRPGPGAPRRRPGGRSGRQAGRHR